MADVSLEFIARRLAEMQEETRQLRLQNRDVLDALTTVQRQIINLDRRLTDVKDELEGTIRIELGGRVAHAETRIENRTAQQVGESVDLVATLFAEEQVPSFEEFYRNAQDKVQQAQLRDVLKQDT